MPPRKYHLEFDDRLRGNDIICEDTDGNTVHARLDRNSKHLGDMHREIDYWHSPEGIRDMIDNIVNSIGNIYPGTATDYVRIAYGHLCLDNMASKLKRKDNCEYKDLDWREIYNRTYHLFRRKGYHKTYYRARYD